MAITDPRDISGLRAWYSAQAETSYADGATMTSWTDLSGNGHHATAVGTPVWQATSGSGGGPAVRFGGAGYFTLPNLMSSATAGEVYMWVKSDGLDCGLWCLDPGTPGASESHFPYAGTVYEKFGLPSGAGLRRAFTPTVSITSWRRYNLWSAPNDWAARLDETTQLTYTGSPTTGWSTAPILGRGRDNGVLDMYFKGHIAAFVLFDRKLTTTERADLAAWMAANPSGGLTGPAPASLSFAASLPPLTADFDLTAESAADLAFAGSLGALTASFGLEVAPEELDFTGSLGSLTADFQINSSVGVSLGFSGSLGSLTADFDLAAEFAADLAFTADLGGLTADFDLDVTPLGIDLEFAASLAPLTASFVLGTDETVIIEDPVVEIDPTLVEVDEVDAVEWSADWHTYPAVTPVPLVGMWNADDVAFVLDGSGTKIQKRRTRLRDRVVIGGVDVTFVNGKRTRVPDYQRTKPFSFGPGSLTVTGINPLLDDLGAYSWLAPWSKVLVQRVDEDDNVVSTDWRGRITSLDVSGAELTLELGGMFSAVAAVQWRGKIPISRRADTTYWLHAMFRKLRQPLPYDEGNEFGVTLTTPPQGWFLNCALDTVAESVKVDGTALTVWYDEDAHSWAQGPVDRDTIHATIYADHGEAKLDVSQDFSADKNEVYATGYNENGLKIGFYVAPGLQVVPPELRPYPMADNAPFGIGTTDADTTDGAGISRLIFRLITLGFLSRDDKSGGFDIDVEEAVVAARIAANMDDFGIGDPLAVQVDGELWNWLWDADASGLTMKEARQRPAYEDKRLGKYNFTATGQLKGLNPHYDPSLIRVSEVVDFGTRMRKGQMARRARRMVHTGPNWSGSLTTQHGFIAGEHNPGDPFDESMILSNRDIREGMNIWVPNFDGGTLFHVSGIDVSDDGFVTRFMLDTRARDTLTLDAILERQAENRMSPAKAFWKQTNNNFTDERNVGSLGEIGGKLSADEFLTGGQWNVFWVPLGKYGLVQRFRSRVRGYVSDISGEFEGSSGHGTGDGIEHFVRIFSEKVNGAWMDAREPDPTADGHVAQYKAARPDYLDRGLLAVYGGDEEDNPCGYGYDHKEDEGATLSGNFFDDAGFPFRAEDCRAYVAIWVPEDAVQLAGWMFRWQTGDMS